MKTFILLIAVITMLPLNSFCKEKTIKTEEKITIEGKAWWYSYYLDSYKKKIYISGVYNNNCNHCDGEIRAAFRKWLIMNDYDSSPITISITNIHDVKESSADERREAKILDYKERGWTVVKVGFSYTDK